MSVPVHYIYGMKFNDTDAWEAFHPDEKPASEFPSDDIKENTQLTDERLDEVCDWFYGREFTGQESPFGKMSLVAVPHDQTEEGENHLCVGVIAKTVNPKVVKKKGKGKYSQRASYDDVTDLGADLLVVLKQAEETFNNIFSSLPEELQKKMKETAINGVSFFAVQDDCNCCN